eukprot:5211235-Pyramimonas_sp.AAC.1
MNVTTKESVLSLAWRADVRPRAGPAHRVVIAAATVSTRLVVRVGGTTTMQHYDGDLDGLM